MTCPERTVVVCRLATLCLVRRLLTTWMGWMEVWESLERGGVDRGMKRVQGHRVVSGSYR